MFLGSLSNSPGRAFSLQGSAVSVYHVVFRIIPSEKMDAKAIKCIFNGTNPNGTWSLYAVDDLGGDIGGIAGGWGLTIKDDSSAAIPESSSLALLWASAWPVLARCAAVKPPKQTRNP